MLDTPDLSGRVAFVTGTTRPIGKALTPLLADCEATVVSSGKTTEADATALPGA
ncbi:hypothetical protein ACFQPA_02600 [Halomarina halobia]|uniref:Uncharacterized protein n=1 Tax=Halomarina halobia TaxID=3033386 RepID=A0ABD6A5D0_9EURY|nr:hypothetical protein [Halomarina sp. PSR21]